MLTKVVALAFVAPLCGVVSVDLKDKVGACTGASQLHRYEGGEGQRVLREEEFVMDSAIWSL